jgi:nicotinamidase-related amidase
VPDGRDIVPIVNELLSLPFASKIATKDWHPQNHVSFASNHLAPGNIAFLSHTTIVHPSNPSRTYETLLWPDHCVQNTPGADLVPQMHNDRFDVIIEKGNDPMVEMYSAFTDPFHEAPFTPESTSIATSGLPKILHDKGITHVYVVGLAQDYCVKASALDSVKFGYETFGVVEGTKAVAPGEGWDVAEKDMIGAGVKMVKINGGEVEWVKSHV